MVASGVLLINEDREIGKKQGCINNAKERQAGPFPLFQRTKQNEIRERLRILFK